ncbi:hypothetical protein J3A83DRAFT_2404823 [Scleroderma citrinum]
MLKPCLKTLYGHTHLHPWAAQSLHSTHIFLGYRIWRLTDSALLYAIVIVLAVPTFALGVTCSIKAWIIYVMIDMPRITNLVIAWVVMQVIVDGFVTTTLAYNLIRAKTGWPRTDIVLRRLIRGAIQTGLFATILQLGDLVSFLVMPETNFYGMFAIPVGRIYSNTLLDTLLVREQLKAEMTSSAYERTSRMMGWVPSERVPRSAAATSIYLDVQKRVEEHRRDADVTSFDGEKNVALGSKV